CRGGVISSTSAQPYVLEGNLDKCTITVVAANVLIKGRIDGGSDVRLTGKAGPVAVEGRVDGGSKLTLVGHSIHIGGNIDGGSEVHLPAPRGGIAIDGKIDGDSQVTLRAKGPIVIAGSLASRKTHVAWCAPALDSRGKIATGAKLEKIAD